MGGWWDGWYFTIFRFCFYINCNSINNVGGQHRCCFAFLAACCELTSVLFLCFVAQWRCCSWQIIFPLFLLFFPWRRITFAFAAGDPCRRRPCRNGATCNANRQTHSYTCSCRSGYYGDHCELRKCRVWSKTRNYAKRVPIKYAYSEYRRTHFRRHRMDGNEKKFQRVAHLLKAW